MKNVLFWIGVKSDNKELLELKNYGDWEWMEYSKKTWQYWCTKHNVEFVHYDHTSNPDILSHLVNWQRWFDVFDFLDTKGIEYDQIMLVDASSMVHWNAPDFFKISDRKWCAFRANENMKWSMESTDGYRDLFPGINFRYNDYIASGLAIFNKSHKEFLLKLKEFYYDNYESIIQKQKTIKRGTDQPIINYMLRKHDIDINYLRLPYACNHLYRREMLSYNWQLNEDMSPFFIKYLYIWFFSGLSDRGNTRKQLMKQTWDYIGHYYDPLFILNNVLHKDTYVKTTSYKFKQDLINVFGNNFKDKTVLELGCCRGDTTQVLSVLFNKVIAVDISNENIKDAKQKYPNADNIDYITADVYKDFIWPDHVDVIIIDASHEKHQVYLDIQMAMSKYSNPILVLDDYGNVSDDIRDAVNKHVSEGTISISRYIGENAGYSVTRLNGDITVFCGAEGVICNLKG